jgi:hypothetical protein
MIQSYSQKQILNTTQIGIICCSISSVFKSSLFFIVIKTWLFKHFNLLKYSLFLWLFFSQFTALKAQTLFESLQPKYRSIQPAQGRLIESSIVSKEIYKLNGALSSDTSSYDLGREALRQVMTMEYGNDLSMLDIKDSIWKAKEREYIGQNILPIGIIDYEYFKISDELVAANRLKVSDKDSSFYFDLNGYSGALHQKGYCFTIVLPIEYLRTDVEFGIIDSNLFFSNLPTSKSDVIRLAVGDEVIEVKWNVPFLLPRVSGSAMLFHFLKDILANDPRVKLFNTPWFQESTKTYRTLAKFILRKNKTVTDNFKYYADSTFEVNEFEHSDNSSIMKAKYITHFGYEKSGKVRKCLMKPLIMVEGIDFGYKGYPNVWKDGKYGENGYLDLLNGKSWNVPEQKWDYWEAIENSPSVIETFRRNGYDIVYIDFYDGAQDMNINAEVVIGVIQQIQQRMCGMEMHVLGVSMGGVVAKRALRQMELRKLPNCVLSFTTFDSPHLGANIPLGLQKLISCLRENSDDLKDKFHRVLRRPATRQLLVVHEESEINCSSYRELWVREDSLYGNFPKKPWLFGIANGSSLGELDLMKSNNVTMQPGDLLVKLKLPWYIRTGIFGKDLVELYAVHKSTKRNLLAGEIVNYIDLISHSVNLKWDHVAGSYIEKFDFVKALDKSLLVDGKVYFDKTAFIPSFSALSITSKRYNLYTLPGVNYQMTVVLQGYTLNEELKSPFHRMYTPKRNQAHIKLDTSKGGNIEWLITQLNSIEITSGLNIVSDYNLRSPNLRFVPGVKVNNGAHFELNGLYDFPILTNKEKSEAILVNERVFYTKGCGEDNVVIEKNGKFSVGQKDQATIFNVTNGSVIIIKKDATFRIAHGLNKVFVGRGSQFIIEDGGSLIIEDGGQLIVEEGGEFILRGKGNIYLNGQNSLLHFKGNLVLEDAAVFNPKTTDQTIGLVKFTSVRHGYGEAAVVVLGNDNSFIFDGNGMNGHRNLQIEGDFYFSDLKSEIPFKEFKINKSNVILAPASSLNLMGKVEIINSQFDKVEWTSKYSGTVRYYGNNLILNSCKFIKLDTGLVYNSENRETAIELKGLTWDNCNVGFSVNKGLTDLRNCTFNENKIGVNLSEIWHEALLVGLKFTNNNMGINVSNSNEGIGQLLMSDCKSENNGIVLSSYQTEVLLKCNHFKKNEMDIMAEKCLLNLANTEKIKSKILAKYVSCGFNLFESPAENSIVLKNAEVLLNGQNYFTRLRSEQIKPFIYGHFRLIETKPYWDFKTSKLDVGSNLWRPIFRKTYIADSLSNDYIDIYRYSNLTGKIAVKGSLDKDFYYEACYTITKDVDQIEKPGQKINDDPLVNGNIAPRIFLVESNEFVILEENLFIEIYNSAGALIKKVNNQKVGHRIMLSTGIYFLRIQQGDSIYNEKIFVE